MSFGYDPELPAGYQEADLEMVELEAQAGEHAHLHRQGVCTHGWKLGRGAGNLPGSEIEACRQAGRFPDRPTDPSLSCQADIPEGRALCLHCGEIVSDELV